MGNTPFTSDTFKGIYSYPGQRVFLGGDCGNTVIYRTVYLADRRTSTASAHLINHRDRLRFNLPSSGKFLSLGPLVITHLYHNKRTLILEMIDGIYDASVYHQLIIDI